MENDSDYEIASVMAEFTFEWNAARYRPSFRVVQMFEPAGVLRLFLRKHLWEFAEDRDFLEHLLPGYKPGKNLQDGTYHWIGFVELDESASDIPSEVFFATWKCEHLSKCRI